MRISQIAQITHETMRAYCHSIGDKSLPAWDNLSTELKKSAISGVAFVEKNLPEIPSPEMQHAAWMTDKYKAGWKYGKVKDEKKKTHPCLVVYHKLPKKQRVKDMLFASVAYTLLTEA